MERENENFKEIKETCCMQEQGFYDRKMLVFGKLIFSEITSCRQSNLNSMKDKQIEESIFHIFLKTPEKFLETNKNASQKVVGLF